MKKNIWILNHYAMPPEYEPRVRNNKMAHFMEEKGYNVTIFAASSLHNTDINLITDKQKFIRKQYGDLKFVHIRAPQYKGNGIGRKINMLLFPFRLWKYTKKIDEKPDAIVSDLELMGFFYPALLARRYKCTLVTEIRDLWPESIIEFGLLKRNSLVAKILFLCEKYIYKYCDAVIFTKEGEVNYIREKKWDKESGGPIDMKKVHYINNGVDINEFEENITKYQIQDLDLEDESTFKVVYVGAIRHANNVSRILDVAKELMNHSNIKFLIYGDGDEREELEKRVREDNITNVIFKGNVNKKYIPYILSKSSLNVLNYMQSGTWARGNSSNKLFEYMASGKPILSTIKMGYCIIDKYKCGFSLEKGTNEEFIKMILRVKDMPEDEYKKLCENAKDGAKDFDYKVLTDRLIEVIENI